MQKWIIFKGYYLYIQENLPKSLKNNYYFRVAVWKSTATETATAAATATATETATETASQKPQQNFDKNQKGTTFTFQSCGFWVAVSVAVSVAVAVAVSVAVDFQTATRKSVPHVSFCIWCLLNSKLGLHIITFIQIFVSCPGFYKEYQPKSFCKDGEWRFGLHPWRFLLN